MEGTVSNERRRHTCEVCGLRYLPGYSGRTAHQRMAHHLAETHGKYLNLNGDCPGEKHCRSVARVPPGFVVKHRRCEAALTEMWNAFNYWSSLVRSGNHPVTIAREREQWERFQNADRAYRAAVEALEALYVPRELNPEGT